MVDAFVDAGLLVTEDHNDRAPNLIKKYRRTLKRLKLTPELAYRDYDPRNIGFVIRTEFTDILRL